MARFYYACPQCNKRMVRFNQDDDGERLYYVCHSDGYRVTFMPRSNGMSTEWPREIFELAVREGVLTKKGSVVR